MSVLGFLRRHRAGGSEEELAPDLHALALKLEETSLGHAVPSMAAQAARQRMHAALRVAREAQPASVVRRPGGLIGAFASRRRLTVASALAALMLLVAAGGLGLLFGSFGGPLASPSAEAIVIQGTLDSQSADGITLITASGSEVATLDGGLVVVDAVGNPISLDSLLKGQAISVKGKRGEDRLVVSEIKAVGEVHGRIVSFSSSLLRLTSAAGDFDVIVTPATKIEGTLRNGAEVEVEITRTESGALVAKEIEVDDGGGEEDDEGRDEKSASPPSSSGPSISVGVSVSGPASPDNGRGAPAPPAGPTEIQRAAPPPPSPTRTPTPQQEEDDEGQEEFWNSPSANPASTPSPVPTPTSGSGYHGDDDDDHHDECDHDDEDDPCEATAN